MIARFTASLLLLGSEFAAGAPPKWDEAEIRKSIEATRVEWRVPGLAAVIVKDGRVVHLAGYGTKTLGRDDPVTPDTIFPLASCTKGFTSALMASFVESGDVGWDDPVRKHLPTFRLADPDADKLVALRDLLTHRSGLGGHDLLWYRAPWDAEEVLRRTAKLPLTAPFRGGFQYSSLPFTAAGKAIENRTGSGYAELVRARITAPLGMKSVAFTTAEAKKNPDRAAGHELRLGKPVPMAEYDAREADAAGSMYASIRDLGTWVQFHLNKGKFDGKQLIAAKQLAETKQPHTPMRKEGLVAAIYPDSHQVSYAMGWVVYDHRGKLVVAHGGIIDGFRVQITLLPEENLGFATLNNLHETKMNIALTNALIDRLLGLEPKDWTAYYRGLDRAEADEKLKAKQKRDRARNPKIAPTASLDAHTGEYEHPAYGVGRVKRDGGQLIWEWSSFRVPFEHWQADQFRATSGFFDDEIFQFQADKDGAVTGLTQRGIEFRKK